MSSERIITAATVTTGEKTDGQQLPDLVYKTENAGTILLFRFIDFIISLWKVRLGSVAEAHNVLPEILKPPQYLRVRRSSACRYMMPKRQTTSRYITIFTITTMRFQVGSFRTYIPLTRSRPAGWRWLSSLSVWWTSISICRPCIPIRSGPFRMVSYILHQCCRVSCPEKVSISSVWSRIRQDYMICRLPFPRSTRRRIHRRNDWNCSYFEAPCLFVWCNCPNVPIW